VAEQQTEAAPAPVEPRSSRAPYFLVAALAGIFGWSLHRITALDRVHGVETLAGPLPKSAEAWFGRIKAFCTSELVLAAMDRFPPLPDASGAAYAQLCWALAGEPDFGAAAFAQLPGDVAAAAERIVFRIEPGEGVVLNALTDRLPPDIADGARLLDHPGCLSGRAKCDSGPPTCAAHQPDGGCVVKRRACACVEPVPEPEVADGEPADPIERAKELERDGRMYFLLGDLDDAEAAFKKCVETAPYSKCYRELGILYMQRKKTPLAIESYRRYLELEPEAVDAPEIHQAIERAD
jgi:tetratricopeptide (TPR) repeat protein